MSFSSRTKLELCRLPAGRFCCARAEIYGALLFGFTFRHNEIRVVTENPELPLRLSRLLGRVFGFDFDSLPNAASAMGKQTLTLTSKDKLTGLFGDFGYGISGEVALHLNNAVLENECCTAAFLRGAFLTGGSVTDPEKEYHLELRTPHLRLSREVLSLLREADFTPNTAVRAGHHVLYIKASEKIEDFLTMAGAPRAALGLMETKVEKDLRNLVNRKVNCETANLSKTVEAAMRQTEAFERMRRSALWETLSPALRETAELRIRFPQDTLSELCGRFAPPLGRSGLNHRLRKLMELAEDSGH